MSLKILSNKKSCDRSSGTLICKKCCLGMQLKSLCNNVNLSKDDAQIHDCRQASSGQRRFSAQDASLVNVKMIAFGTQSDKNSIDVRSVSHSRENLPGQYFARYGTPNGYMVDNTGANIVAGRLRRESFIYKSEYCNMIEMSRSVSRHSSVEHFERPPAVAATTSTVPAALLCKTSSKNDDGGFIDPNDDITPIVNLKNTENFVYPSVIVKNTLVSSDTNKTEKINCKKNFYTSEMFNRRTSGSLIVTPFAQILASLQQLRQHFDDLSILMDCKEYDDNDDDDGTINDVEKARKREVTRKATIEEICIDSPYLKLINETLPQVKPSECLSEVTYLFREISWCLMQLESMSVKSSIGHLASDKFQHLLNHELEKMITTTHNGVAIGDYIKSFIEKEYEFPIMSNKSSESSAIGVNTKTIASESLPMQNLIEHEAENCCTNHADVVEGIYEVEERLGQMVLSSMLEDVLHQQPLIDHYIYDTEKHVPPSYDTSLTNNDNIPLCGIETEYEMELNNLLDQDIDRWGIDIFNVNQLSSRHPLVAVTYKIFQRRNFLRQFCIPDHVLINFAYRIEENYLTTVSYHNATHAADVTQSAHVLLCSQSLEGVFSDFEMLAVIVACAIHDTHHPGVTNQFLINTGHALTILYNDSSVLENHHLSVAFKILMEKNCDIFVNVHAKQRQTIRKIIIDLVLATDMSKHMCLLADLKTLVETKKVASSGILNLDIYSDRIQILQGMVHCADLSNPTKPLQIYRQWTSRIMGEFFRQGEMERDRNLDISPMCDRLNASIEKSQVSFIDFIVHPLWETWSDLVHPSAQYILDHLEMNRAWFSAKVPLSQSQSLQLEKSSPEQHDSSLSSDDANKPLVSYSVEQTSSALTLKEVEESNY